MSKKHNKIAQGMISLVAIILLLCSVIATSFFYQTGITGNVIIEDLPDYDSKLEIQELNNINSLSQFNEGWYKVINGYVYYVDTFNLLVPLYIKIKNPSYLNGIAVVDEDGKVIFDANQWNIPEKQQDKIENDGINDEISSFVLGKERNRNEITGLVGGLAEITGMQAAELPQVTKITVKLPWAWSKVIELENGRWYEKGSQWAIDRDVYRYIYETYPKLTRVTQTWSNDRTADASSDSVKQQAGQAYVLDAVRKIDDKQRDKAVELVKKGEELTAIKTADINNRIGYVYGLSGTDFNKAYSYYETASKMDSSSTIYKNNFNYMKQAKIEKWEYSQTQYEYTQPTISAEIYNKMGQNIDILDLKYKDDKRAFALAGYDGNYYRDFTDGSIIYEGDSVRPSQKFKDGKWYTRDTTPSEITALNQMASNPIQAAPPPRPAAPAPRPAAPPTINAQGVITLTSSQQTLADVLRTKNQLNPSGFIIIGDNNKYYNLNKGDAVQIAKGTDNQYYIANPDGFASSQRILISTGDTYVFARTGLTSAAQANIKTASTVTKTGATPAAETQQAPASQPPSGIIPENTIKVKDLMVGDVVDGTEKIKSISQPDADRRRTVIYESGLQEVTPEEAFVARPVQRAGAGALTTVLSPAAPAAAPGGTAQAAPQLPPPKNYKTARVVLNQESKKRTLTIVSTGNAQIPYVETERNSNVFKYGEGENAEYYNTRGERVDREGNILPNLADSGYKETGAFAEAFKNSQESTLKVRHKTFSLDEIRLVYSGVSSASLTKNQRQQIFDDIESNKLQQLRGVTTYERNDGTKIAYTSAGKSVSLGGIEVTPPKDNMAHTVLFEGGNLYQIDGQKYALIEGKLKSLDVATGINAGKHKVINPNDGQIGYEVLGFNINTKIIPPIGQLVAGVRVGQNVLPLELRDGENIRNVQFSTQGLTEAEVEDIIAHINRATELVPNTLNQKGTVTASQEFIQVELDGVKTTYTMNSILKMKNGQKIEETQYQAGRNGARITVKQIFNPDTRQITSLSINGNTVNTALLSPESLNNIDWINYQQGSSIYPMNDKTTVTIHESTAITKDATGNEIRKQEVIENGERITESKYQGRTMTSQTITSTTQSNGIQTTEKQTIHLKDGKPVSTNIERSISKENEPTVNIQFSTTGRKAPSDSTLVILNGNTISYGNLKKLGLDFVDKPASQELYDGAKSVSTLLKEATNFGIDLTTAKVSYTLITPIQPPKSPLQPVIINGIPTINYQGVISELHDTGGRRTVAIKRGDLSFVYLETSRGSDIFSGKNSKGEDAYFNLNFEEVDVGGKPIAVAEKNKEFAEIFTNLFAPKSPAQIQSPARILTSSDGLRELRSIDDGSLELRYFYGTGNIRTLTTKNADGSITETSCNIPPGCTEKNNQLTGKRASIEYNENDNTVKKTTSNENEKDYDVIVEYGAPPDIGKDNFIRRISINDEKGKQIQNLNLGDPDDKGYQLISGSSKYYKDGEIYVKSGNDYKRSADAKDKAIEAQIKDAKVKDLKNKADEKRGKFYKKERKERRVEKVQTIFESVERIFGDFRGLQYYASFFIDDKDLQKWQLDVDEKFQKYYLGTEYWTSKICTDYANLKTDNEGVAYAETPQGLAQIAAHIEATRTPPIVNEKEETIYIYKITFQIRNGDYETDMRAPENMSINVFIGDSSISDSPGSGIQLFKKNINIGRGSSFGRFGSQTTEKSAPAIVKESRNVHEKICIKFDKIPLKWKIKNNILCNAVVQSSGEPTQLASRTQTQQGTDADLNDF